MIPYFLLLQTFSELLSFLLPNQKTSLLKWMCTKNLYRKWIMRWKFFFTWIILYLSKTTHWIKINQNKIHLIFIKWPFWLCSFSYRLVIIYPVSRYLVFMFRYLKCSLIMYKYNHHHFSCTFHHYMICCSIF